VALTGQEGEEKLSCEKYEDYKLQYLPLRGSGVEVESRIQ